MGGVGNSREALEAKNGCVRSGRPRKYPEGIRREQQRAREAGAAFLPSIMAFWIKTVRDPHADFDHRNRAAENIANRCGLPVKAIFDGDAAGGFTIEKLAHLFRETDVRTQIEAGGKVEATDVPFTEIEAEKITAMNGHDTQH